MEARGARDTTRRQDVAHWKRTTEADKKRRILDAVIRLVVKYGVHGTTTAGIAAEAGMSEPTLYRTYQNKKEVLLAAADAAWQTRQAGLASAGDSNALEHLRNLAKHHTQAVQTTPDVELVYHFAIAPPEYGLLEHIREQIESDVRHLADVIDEGKAQGSIRPDADSLPTAWRLMAAYWSESTARLFHFEEAVLASGLSSQSFDSIFKEIAAERRG